MTMRIIIIGAGPGGYETALLAARRGVEVVLVEAGHVGGTCLNEGCIPTKAFCKNAEVLDSLREAEVFGVTDLTYGFDFKAVTARKNAVVEQLRGGVEGLLGHKLITLVRGNASFKDTHTVTVDGQDYVGDYIIIATGSVSASLPIPGADLPGILTSREILDLEEVPQKLCVIGGGVIGLEFASVFRSFGCEVTVLEYFKEILPRFDSDLSKRLKQSLGKRGIEISTQTQVTAIEECDGKYKISFSRKGKEESVEADKVLMAVGRKANVDSLNLTDVGIELTSRGIVVDDKTMQTNIPHIYAVGDINGKMMLAHAATFQGIVALDHIMGIENGIDLSVMPAAVFTSPEAASVGKTEEECKEVGIPIKCLKSFFRANGKAVTMGETDGFCKVIVAAESKDGGESPYEPGRILGCHLYGPHASDIVQEACALITQKATLSQFENIIHTHPTLTEVLQSAVHN
ncbi:MAG: dihydrolipoyl dehydrogenase [Bacteroidales bacterium]|nr:dihydrolipoyl dehydrogenase [Bacteroidales bacterium]MBR5861987.1 dihydrolipoyl dehydrogenase [Bacteroidales bacterium]